MDEEPNLFFVSTPGAPSFQICVTGAFVVDASEAVAIALRLLARAVECDAAVAMAELRRVEVA